MNLAIDFGNTYIKAAIFDGERLVRHFLQISQMDLLKLSNEHVEYKIILSSVSNESTHFINLIENKQRLIVFRHGIALPIKNLYETPETLGSDRIAGAIGAASLFPNSDCLVIDSGTSLTFDFIDKEGIYHGGSISLGISMRYKALNTFTSKLPLLDTKENVFGIIGKNTSQAIIVGVLEGIIGEVNWVIDSYRQKFPQIKIVICGGDLSFFETKIKDPIFVIPELVLVGLNRILNYNATQV